MAWWKRWWARLAGGLAFIVLVGTAWGLLAPADWMRPQYFFITPSPQAASAEAARRWPSLGPAGATQDSVLLRVKGVQLPRNLRERNWRLIFYWSLGDSDSAMRHIAWQTGRQAGPTNLPMFAVTSGPWDADITVQCPSDFRGFIRVVPILVSPSDFNAIARRSAAPMPIKETAIGRRGNEVLAETAGVTQGEIASPYRQVESLNSNVPIASFRRILGPETSWNYLHDGREYLFITHEYCVQAIVDAKGLVLMYTVTTLRDDFKPTFRYFAGSEQGSVTIGVTRFSEVKALGGPTAIWASLYANRYSYCESFWLAGVSDYQTLLIGNNYLGKPTLEAGDMMGMFGLVTRAEARRLAPARKVNIINTFGMCAPDPVHMSPPPQFIAAKGWIGPTLWDLDSATLSNQTPAAGTPAASASPSPTPSAQSPRPKATIEVERSGYSVGTKGYPVGYGVVLRNTSAFDAFDVAVAVKLRDGARKMIGSDEDYIAVIPAGTTFYQGGELDVKRSAAPATFKVSVDIDHSGQPKHTLLQATDLRIADEKHFGIVGAVVRGKVTNDTERTLSSLSLFKCVLFDETGNVVGGGFGFLDSPLRPGRTASFATLIGTPGTAADRVTTAQVSVDCDWGRY